MRIKVYIETTIVSYYTAPFSRDLVIAGHQQATRDFWMKTIQDFEVYISALVIKESGKGDAIQAKKRLDAIASFPVLDIDPEAEKLAGRIVAGGGISDKYPEDALHIENEGCICPEIVSPDELLGEEP